jgi:hypothetical protein
MATITLTMRHTRHEGIGLSTDTKPSANYDDRIYETDTKDEYKCFGGDDWGRISIGGAGLVILGIGAAETFTRFYDLAATYAATTHYEEFTEADNIRAIIVTPYSATGTALQADEYCRVLCDAPDAMTAGLFLALTGGVGLDMGWETTGTTKPFSRVFSSYLTSLALLPVNDAMKVMVTFIKGGA